MKIHFIASNTLTNTGGSELLWNRAVRRLVELGHQVSLMVAPFATEPDDYAWFRSKGVSITYYEVNRTRLRQKLAHYFRGPADRRSIEQIKRNNPDLVLISQGGCFDGLEWAALCLQYDLPFALLSQAVPLVAWPSDTLVDRLHSIFYKARQNFFVSHGNLDLMETWLAAKLNPSAVIWNPCRIPHDISLPWPSSTSPWKMACVARITPADKGQDLILDVMKRDIWRERPIEIHFYGTGPSLRGFKKLAERYKLDRKLFFHGEVNDIRAIWTDHHALLLPSRSEGFSLAMTEAMRCRRPVITTCVGDNERLIAHGESGFLCPATTIDALASTMEEAWRLRDRWETIGAKGGEAIRRFVPSHPENDFVEALLRCAGMQNAFPEKKAA